MNIKYYRKQKAMTQKELAKALGINMSLVSKYETGVVTPPLSKLNKMAEIFGVSVSQILGDDSEKTTVTPYSASSTENDKLSVVNPEVSTTVLAYAAGVCELCGQPAPFYDEGGNPYLETHYVQWLSEGGSPTPDNMVALCPNCHKKVHILHTKEDLDKLLLAASKHLIR